MERSRFATGRASTFTLNLTARAERDTVRLVLAGDGRLEPLSPWLPSALVRAAGTRSGDVRAELGLEPGDRLAGRASAGLGDLVAIEGMLSLREGLLGVTGIRGAADLGFAGSMAGLRDPIQGRAELSDGEVSWAPAKGGWPRGQAVLRLPGTALPASAAGLDVRLRGIETKLALEPKEGGAAARGELRGEQIELAGVPLGPLTAPWRVDLDSAGGVSRVELTGLTARVLGAPVRGTVAYDAARARADARLEADGVPLQTLVRERWPGWLGPTDQLRAGSVRVDVAGLDPRGWSDGRVDAEIRTLALRQPEGEASVDLARIRASVQSGTATIGLEAQRLRGTLPAFEGQLPRVDGSADVVREGTGVSLSRAALVGRDGQGRDMFQVDLRSTASPAGPVRLAARVPALERLAPLWPSVPRQVTGSATLELEAPDLRFSAYEGRMALQVVGAELLGGKLSLRDVSADVPVRRGKGGTTAGRSPGGSLTVNEAIGYGVVLYDIKGRPTLADDRLTLEDLRYGLYSGQGQGTIEVDLTAATPAVQGRFTGEGVRIDEFIAAYGIRGGTMTGLMRYDLTMRYRGNRLGADGGFQVPEGGTVTIELLDRFLEYASADPTGVVKRALGNLRAFDFKSADATVRTASDDIRVSLSLQGRERFGIFPPRVKEINVRDMPIGFLARQFPGQ